MYVLISFYFYACYLKPKVFFLGFDQISPGTVSPAATGCFPSCCHTRQVRAWTWIFRDPDQDISTPKILARVDPDQDISTPKIRASVVPDQKIRNPILG
jgi:hypothetical protein